MSRVRFPSPAPKNQHSIECFFYALNPPTTPAVAFCSESAPQISCRSSLSHFRAAVSIARRHIAAVLPDPRPSRAPHCTRFTEFISSAVAPVAPEQARFNALPSSSVVAASPKLSSASQRAPPSSDCPHPKPPYPQTAARSFLLRHCFKTRSTFALFAPRVVYGNML